MRTKPVLMGLGLAVGLAGSLTFVTGAEARDQIRIVGSSTVYPFSTAVAERFGKIPGNKTPVVESTGTGGGMKLFCSGMSDEFPDMTNASRRIKSSEVELCASNGVDKIVEVKVGYDGIVFANSTQGESLQFSRRDIFLALAKDIPAGEGKWIPNPHKTWRDVNPSLPNKEIKVFGPPPTSGTRDAFVELALEGGCKTFDWVKALKSQDKNTYKARCHSIREDLVYVDAGENDNLIVQKLVANKDAFGIFGFSFLDQNADRVRGSLVEGTPPTFENISDGSYPVSRSLYFYAKSDRIPQVPGMNGFLTEFTSERAWGEEGYLSDKGLIPMGDEERAEWRDNVKGLHELGSF